MVSQRTGLKARRMPTAAPICRLRAAARRPAFVAGCGLSSDTPGRPIAGQIAAENGRVDDRRAPIVPRARMEAARRLPGQELTKWVKFLDAHLGRPAASERISEHHALAIHAGSRWCVCRCRTAVAGMNGVECRPDLFRTSPPDNSCQRRCHADPCCVSPSRPSTSGGPFCWSRHFVQCTPHRWARTSRRHRRGHCSRSRRVRYSKPFS